MEIAMTGAVLYSRPTDEDLMRKCAAGDHIALRDLIQRYQMPIFAFLARRLDSPDDAEDATVETFIRLWNGATSFQFRSSVATWLYRIAINISRDHRIRKMRRPREVSQHEAANLPYSFESAETSVLRMSG